MAKYVLSGTHFEKILVNDPDYILKDVKFHDCPMQQNTYDCGLFATIVVLHLLNDVNVDVTTFTQSNITKFRESLYEIFKAKPDKQLPDPKIFISRTFIESFFSKLKKPVIKPDPFLIYLEVRRRSSLEQKKENYFTITKTG